MISAPLAAAAMRIAIAIVCDTAALVVWDIGTRSPLRLAADLRAGLHDMPTLVRGTRRLLIGICAIATAVIVSRPVTDRAIDFTIVECWALVTALVVEQLIGPDLRARRR